jgi:hypothetical protein
MAEADYAGSSRCCHLTVSHTSILEESLRGVVGFPVPYWARQTDVFANLYFGTLVRFACPLMRKVARDEGRGAYNHGLFA